MCPGSPTSVVKTGPILTNRTLAIGPVWPLPFQPRVLPLDHTLIQLLEEQRRSPQRLPRRQFARRPGAHCATVVVGQRLVGAGLLLVLDYVLRAKELPLVPQVLVQPLGPVRSTGVCGRIGARIISRLATARNMTYTVVTAA